MKKVGYVNIYLILLLPTKKSVVYKKAWNFEMAHIPLICKFDIGGFFREKKRYLKF